MNEALMRDLLHSYYKARKHKRNTLNQLRFEQNLESNLLSLEEDLRSENYELSPGILFINEKPVKREIIAADFRDRVVHHLLFDWIYPIFDRQFIYDSYSCRTGKGTLFGVRRAEGFMRAVSADYQQQAWVLRLDILGYFMSIQRSRLYELVCVGLDKAHYWQQLPEWQAKMTRFLLQKIIFHDPVQNSELRGSPNNWKGLPHSKSLIAAPPGCGLPIGNLTSQLFGNIYLNGLDHFIKRKLKIRHYGRYVDDMLFLHHDKKVLKALIPQVREYLQIELGLTLHPQKIHLQALQYGFPFLGMYLKPGRTYVGQRIKKNARHAFADYQSGKPLNASQQSYIGLMEHHASYSLRKRFLRE
jgi:retron-type reverse transcriptase